MRLGVMMTRNLDKLEWTSEERYRGQPDDIENGVRTIDVYWVLDDGGLTVLIPHVTALHQFWQDRTCGRQGECPVRLFLVGDARNVEDAQAIAGVTSMISRFRLGFGEPIMLDTKGNDPELKTIFNFDEKNPSSELSDNFKQDRTALRWLRVAELIKENSSKAAMIYCTLPYPKTTDDPFKYMGVVDALSDQEPPTILIRGANQNVLTFYNQ